MSEAHSTSPYVEFLDVANRAAREASPEQRMALRVVASQHLAASEATERIREIMQW
jgi:hypothetical protein